MGKMISYRVNYEKAIETIVWLANQRPGIDIYHVAKIIFYAEKMHVNRYAKPIIGDTYICMDYGQVPSGIRDLITENSWLNPTYLQTVADSIKINKKPYPTLKAQRKPKMEYFSGTDLECLKESLSEYGDKSFDELKKMTHEEKCWAETELNQSIDYALIVDEDNPRREEILQEMSETSSYIQV